MQSCIPLSLSLSLLIASWLLGRPSASCAAQLAKAMASARLADEVLTHLGDFLDDPELCALACSERMRWDRSSLQRQTRKDEQLHVLLLSGRAECRDDCECAAVQLGGVNVEPFLGECFWGGRHELDLRFHVEFCSSRRDLPLLCLAVETWLGRLQAMSDMHVLRETLTFHDEFTGDRRYDDGAYHRFDIPRRVFDKVARHCRRARPWDMDFIVWGAAVKV